MTILVKHGLFPVTKYLGYFCNNICCKELEKIGRVDPWSWSGNMCRAVFMTNPSKISSTYMVRVHTCLDYPFVHLLLLKSSMIDPKLHSNVRCSRRGCRRTEICLSIDPCCCRRVVLISCEQICHLLKNNLFASIFTNLLPLLFLINSSI